MSRILLLGRIPKLESKVASEGIPKAYLFCSLTQLWSMLWCLFPHTSLLASRLRIACGLAFLSRQRFVHNYGMFPSVHKIKLNGALVPNSNLAWQFPLKSPLPTQKQLYLINQAENPAAENLGSLHSSMKSSSSWKTWATFDQESSSSDPSLWQLAVPKSNQEKIVNSYKGT